MFRFAELGLTFLIFGETPTITAKKSENVQTWLISSQIHILGWWNMIIFFKWVICRFHLSSLEGILTIVFLSIHHFENSNLNFYWGVSNRWKHQKPTYPCLVTTWGATTSVPADCSGLANAFGTGLVVFFLFCVALGGGLRHVLDAECMQYDVHMYKDSF